MSTTFTTKYGLIKPTPGTSEIVNVADLNLNSDTIDAALGAQVVNDGVVIPPASIRDGMIVSEKTTGICYVLVKNNVGGFDKRYLSSPYLYVAQTPSATVGGTGAFTVWGWLTYNAAASVNASASDLVAGTNFWKAPFKGIFQINYVDNFGALTGGFRASALSFNGTVDAINTFDVNISNGGTAGVNKSSISKLLNAGDIVGHSYLLQNTQATVTTSVSISCIQRLS